MPYLDYSYLDPLHIVWRDGTPEDPYVLRTEFIKVVNQTVVLSEVPDKVFRVRIGGLNEINYETLNSKGIKPDEFHVNYATGIVHLHGESEGKTLNIVYKGKGFIQYPADRIYYQDKLNNVVYTLKEIIESTKTHSNIVDRKFEELEGILERAEVAINNTNRAIDDADEATEDAIVATDLALEAYETTKLVFKRYVNKFDDIATIYPYPQIGWTVSVYETGERFRYDGIEWVAIDAIGGAVPKASELNDGLLSKEDFVKLQDISENTDVMVMLFVIPEVILNGVQAPILTFGVDGKIMDAFAYVGSKGLKPTPIDIQVSKDYENWTSILDSNIVIDGGSYEDNKNHTIINDVVESDNKYKIIVNTFEADARDLQVIVRMKKD